MNKVDNKSILIDNIFSFMNSNAKIISKNSTPVNSSIHLYYIKNKIEISLWANSHAMGNGSFKLEVSYLRDKVFEADGAYTVDPYDINVKKYIKGNWENTFKGN
jgi:hypothetical protein